MKTRAQTFQDLPQNPPYPVDFLESTFSDLKKSGRKAFIGYITAGFPSKKAFYEIVVGLQQAGIDILEIGVPFSDPVADGPTIQRASQKALAQGVTLSWILNELNAMPEVRIPIVLMSYSNPIVAMGLPDFFSYARRAGVNGVIIPDLIPEEGKLFEQAAKKYGIAVIYLAAPTTTPGRLRRIVKASRGFVYAVSLTGVTGARTTLPQNVRGFLASIRKLTRKPLAVGFGISTPEQVHAVRAHVDGVIVGSALIDHLEKSVPHAARFVASLQKVLNPNPSPSSPRRKPARHTTGAPGRQLCGDLGSSGVGTGFRPSPE